MLSPVCTWMGDRWHTWKPSHVTSHPGQPGHPSLAKHMSTTKSWGVNKHTVRCTSPVSVVLQYKLVSGWGSKEMEISAALRPYGSGMTLLCYVFKTKCNVKKVMWQVANSGIIDICRWSAIDFAEGQSGRVLCRDIGARWPAGMDSWLSCTWNSDSSSHRWHADYWSAWSYLCQLVVLAARLWTRNMPCRTLFASDKVAR